MTQYTPKSTVPYAELTDAPNMQTYAQALATQLDGIVIPKYSDSGARDAANPSPTGGDTCYVGTQNNLQMFYADTSSWDVVVGRVTKSTSIGTIASGWSVQTQIGRKTNGGKLIEIYLSITRTGTTITSTNSNIADTVAFTVTDTSYRPDEVRQMTFMGVGQVNILGTLGTDGILTLRTATFDITSGDNMQGHVTFMTD